MKASLRMVFAIAAVFAFVLSVAAAILISQAHEDVSSEIKSSFSLAEVVLKDESLSDQSVIQLLQNSRHIDLKTGHSFHQAPNESFFTQFYFWLQSEKFEEIQAISVVRKSGLVVTIFPSWVNELNEISESVINVLYILTLALTLSLITVYFGVNHRIKPLKQLCDALDEIGKGHYQTELKGSDIIEIDNLITHYNRMRKQLELHRSQLSQLQQQIQHVQEEERAALARELHDHLGQLITAINMNAYLVIKQSENTEVVKAQSEQISQLCAQLHDGIKQVINRLHPVILSSSGLKTAIKQLVQQWQIQYSIKVDMVLPKQDIPLDLERDTHFYRVLQESLHNITKHSDADAITIELSYREHNLTLKVSDNGQSETKHTNDVGLGHFSMRERAAILKGTFSAGRTLNQHYQIRFSAPLSAGASV